MRRCLRSVVLCVAGLGIVCVAARSADAQTGTLARLHVERDGRVLDGLAFVVNVEPAGDQGIVHLLTAARLLGAGGGRTVRLQMDGRDVSIESDSIFLPFQNEEEIALIRVRMAGVAAFPLLLDQVRAGTVFLVAGLLPTGERTFATERVASVATRVVRGDRPIAGLDACLGAPALGDRGVFGVVTECPPGVPPIVTPLTAARSFLERHVPGLRPRQAETPLFLTTQREFTGPMLDVAYGETREGVIDVPFAVGPGEAVEGVTPRLTSTSGVRLADVTVVRLDDRSVRLRFTVSGAPPPPQTAPWPVAQTLVSIRVNLVTIPRR